MKRNLSMLAAVASLAMVVACVGCSRENKQAKAQVVIYCSVDQQFAQAVLAEFEAKTGIRVLARFDTEAGKTVGLVQRLRAESAAPAADVFWSSEMFHTIRLAREGILAPYLPDDLAGWPEDLLGPDHLWHGLALRGRVIGYNTNRLTAEQAPASLADLLDARWRGRIVMADPRFGTTGGDVASWFVHYGPVRAKEILQGLRDNDVRIVDGNSTAVRMVATGQADICLTDTDDVYAAQRNDWPVAMHPLDQDGDGALTVPNTVAMVAGGPNSAEARKLIDFLLSAQTERMMARSDSHNMPVRPGLAEEFPDWVISRRLDIDYIKVADALPEAIRSAGEILR